MDSIVDLAESRKAKSEKSRQLRQAAKDLLTLLEQQREEISEEFITFLLAMAVSDQALHYAEKAQQWQAGEEFVENLIETTRQLFEANGPIERRAHAPKAKAESQAGRVLAFVSEHLKENHD